MKCEKKLMKLYAVTDRAWVGEKTLYQQVEEALKSGITCLQLREKNLDFDSFLKEANEIHELCKRYNVPLIINDNVEIALKCGAEGVHVGQEDMTLTEVRKLVGEKMIIGVSAHTVEEATQAEKNGADYLGLGAVFSTNTKLDVDVMPKSVVKAICSSVKIPTVAIGGISKKNVMELSGTGVDGIAVVSAIFGAKNISKATSELLELSNQMTSNQREM